MAEPKAPCPYCKKKFSYVDAIAVTVVASHRKDLTYCPYCDARVIWTQLYGHPEKIDWRKP